MYLLVQYISSLYFQLYFIYKNTRYSYQLFYFLFYISFYIGRYQLFQNFQDLIQKKDFWHKFSFFTGFMQLPNPFNSQSLLSMTKVFVDAPLILYLVMKKVTLLSDHTIPCKKSYFFQYTHFPFSSTTSVFAFILLNDIQFIALINSK